MTRTIRTIETKQKQKILILIYLILLLVICLFTNLFNQSVYYNLLVYLSIQLSTFCKKHKSPKGQSKKDKNKKKILAN